MTISSRSSQRAAAALAVACLPLAGCFGPRQVTVSTSTPSSTATISSAATGPEPSTTSQASTANPVSSSTTKPPSRTNSPSPSTNPRCYAHGSDLTASVENGGAGAGSYTVLIKVTNTTEKPCLLIGFPDVSMVTGDNGQQLGKAADRTGSRGTGTTLAAGESGIAKLRVSQAANLDPCSPTPARGLRVYLPGETKSDFAPLDTLIGCNDSAADSLMQISAFGR